MVHIVAMPGAGPEVGVGGMPRPITGATNYHAQLGLPNKVGCLQDKWLGYNIHFITKIWFRRIPIDILC